jgi:hypothetical protein
LRMAFFFQAKNAEKITWKTPFWRGIFEFCARN